MTPRRPERVGVNAVHGEVAGKKGVEPRGRIGALLSNGIIVQQLIHVYDNLLVIRMSVAGLTP